MGVLDVIKAIRSQSQSGFEFRPDSRSLLITLPKDQFEECLKGRAESLLLHQFVALRMLEEQGEAEGLPNGFRVYSDAAVRLDQDARELLELPEPWPGDFDVSFAGQTTGKDFGIYCALCVPDGTKTRQYKLQGPILWLSEQETYLPDPAQWAVLDTVHWHQSLPFGERTEYNNLLAVHRLQEARKQGAQIRLAHFEDLETIIPDSVGVAGHFTENGDLQLIPGFEDLGVDDEDIEKRLGQLSDNQVGSFRVKKNIVLLDEKKLAAAREIIEHRLIPKERVKQFLETPSAFLDPTLVNLELGFSFRMHGATEFKHAYFGQTDATTIEWFHGGAIKEKEAEDTPPNLTEVIKDLDDVQVFRERMEDAKRAGADAFPFNGQTFSLSGAAALERELMAVEEALNCKREKDKDEKEDGEPSEPKEEAPITTTDIDTHDETLPDCLADGTQIDFSPWEGEIDWSTVNRTPYPHQEEGVRWLLGHMDCALKNPRPESGIRGCLLADDMGLGKTYMALIAMAHFLRMREEAGFVPGPILVVAPAILLEIWKEEVDETFNLSPFRDIVILQGQELARFRKGGGRETHLKPGEIRYCLKIGGEEFPTERLDMPERLVLATYDTMRNYQFSMCAVDWSMVVFDEAQAVKNPNSLQTRAAKGLRSGFNLLVTGTPVENDLRDFWCLFDTAFPGFLGAYQDFRKQYMAPIYKSPPEKVAEMREQVGRELRTKVGKFMLRRTKEDKLEGLPEKRIFLGAESLGAYGGILKVKHEPYLECMMMGRQRSLYSDVVAATLTALESGQKGAALRGLHQLRDVSLHAGILNGGTLPEARKLWERSSLEDESIKMLRLLGLIEDIRKREEKAIVFLINRRLQRFLAAALQMKYHFPVPIINGETRNQTPGNAKETRHTMIRRFQAIEGFGLLIMSPLAAGVGLTVTEANNVIHLERHWNPAKEDQATDRVYRIGQNRPVNVYIPIAHHPDMQSFEVNLNALLTRKTDLKDAVVTTPDISPDQMQAQGVFGSKAPSYSEEPITFRDVSSMPWAHFEALVAELASREFDAEVWLTPESGDHGCDVVVLGGSRGNVLIQCKHIAKNLLAGEASAREIFSSRPYYEEKCKATFDKLIVCTNAKKANPDHNETKKRYGVDLWTAKKLNNMLSSHKVFQINILERLHSKRFSFQ